MPNLSNSFQNRKDLNNLAHTMDNMQSVKQEQKKYNQTISSFASQLKNLSNDPSKKAYVLGHLSRISSQISPSDYNEILNNVKYSGQQIQSKEKVKEPEEKKEADNLIDDIRNLEREMNRNKI